MRSFLLALFLCLSLTTALAQEAEPPQPFEITLGCHPAKEIVDHLIEDGLRPMFFAWSMRGASVTYGNPETGTWVQLLVPRELPGSVCVVDAGSIGFKYIPANEFQL